MVMKDQSLVLSDDDLQRMRISIAALRSSTNDFVSLIYEATDEKTIINNDPMSRVTTYVECSNIDSYEWKGFVIVTQALLILFLFCLLLHYGSSVGRCYRNFIIAIYDLWSHKDI
jgi:hypothetical protein